MRENPFTSQKKNVNLKERHERGEKKETDKWINNRNDIDIRKSKKKKKEMKERTEKNIRQNEDERKSGKNKASEEKKIKKEK